MFVLILIAIAFIALACVVPHFYNLAYQWRTLKGIPSLPQNPIIGHGSSFLGKSPAEILTLLWKTQKKYGKLVKYNLVSSLVLTISDPKVAEVRGCFGIRLPSSAYLSTFILTGYLVQPETHFEILRVQLYD